LARGRLQQGGRPRAIVHPGRVDVPVDSQQAIANDPAGGKRGGGSLKHTLE
jgi:hypothetical protein